VELRDLFLSNLREILAVERTLLEEVLPDLLEQTQEKHFRDALEEHAAQTRRHVANVESVFEQLGETPTTEPSYGLRGLRSRHAELAGQIEDAGLRDLANAGAAAHAEHYEISTYHGLITIAELLGEPEAIHVLEQNLHDEEEALEKLEKAIPERLGEKLVRA
jgi:ferritin-like metal-binding protein YciE